MTEREYIKAGNATFTIKSLESGNHLTFRVQRPKAIEQKQPPWFVSVLTGPDNSSDFTFLGTIFPVYGYRHGKKSRIGRDATSAKAFRWFYDHIDQLQHFPVEFLKSGKCCACGRKLTDPESIKLGIGPICRGGG